MPSKSVCFLLGTSVLLAICAGLYAYQQHTMKNTASVYNEARQKKLAAIADEEIRDQLTLLLNQLDALLATKDPLQTPPERTEFTQPYLGELNRYQEPEQMVDAFVEHLLANRESRNSLYPQLPFTPPFPYRLQWQALQLSTGQQIPIETVDATVIDGQPQAFVAGRNIRLSFPNWALDGTDPIPTRLVGRFYMTLPAAIHVVEFNPREVGQQKQIGPYSIRLTAHEGHRTQVLIGRTDGLVLDDEVEHIEIEAKDSQGRDLKRRHLVTGVPDAVVHTWIERFDQWLELATTGNLQQDELAERIQNDLQNNDVLDESLSWQGDASFMGQVDQVRITILVPGERTLEQNLSVPVLHLNHTLKGHNPVSLGFGSSLPDVRLMENLRDWPFELTPEQIESQIKLKSGFQQEEVQLHFQYPDTVSSWFLGFSSRFQQPANGQAAITFHDAKGKAIQNIPADAVTLKDGSIHYIPARFPVEPVRVSGQWQASLMTDLSRRTLTADHLPPGIIIDQDMLLIHEDADLNPNLERRWLARDADGQYLKPVGIEQRQRFEPRPGQRMSAHYFHGRIASLELFESGAISKSTFLFDTKLPKAE